MNQRANDEFYPVDLPVPAEHRTGQFYLRPLMPGDAALDFQAIMGSKEMLRLWSGSPWPQDDFTLADNLKDMEWHWQEHQDRIAFTYTVLDPAGERCLGCVYIKAWGDVLAASGITDSPYLADTGAAIVRFWIVEPEVTNGLDAALLVVLRRWLAESWSFQKVLVHARSVDVRQHKIFAGDGLVYQFSLELPERGGMHQFWALSG